MNFNKNLKVAKMQSTFPMLTEMNQQYIFGLATGLKYVQGKLELQKDMVNQSETEPCITTKQNLKIRHP